MGVVKYYASKPNDDATLFISLLGVKELGKASRSIATSSQCIHKQQHTRTYNNIQQHTHTQYTGKVTYLEGKGLRLGATLTLSHMIDELRSLVCVLACELPTLPSLLALLLTLLLTLPTLLTLFTLVPLLTLPPANPASLINPTRINPFSVRLGGF